MLDLVGDPAVVAAWKADNKAKALELLSEIRTALIDNSDEWKSRIREIVNRESDLPSGVLQALYVEVREELKKAQEVS